jgi:hypothetical protein
MGKQCKPNIWNVSGGILAVILSVYIKRKMVQTVCDAIDCIHFELQWWEHLDIFRNCCGVGLLELLWSYLLFVVLPFAIVYCTISLILKKC